MNSGVAAIADMVGGDNDVDRKIDQLRSSSNIIHMGLLICSFFILISFWAAFLFALIQMILTFVAGLLAWYHLQNLKSVKEENCCCEPLGALRDMFIFDFVIGIVGILSTVTSILAVLWEVLIVWKVFAVICLIACIASTILGFLGCWKQKQLHGLVRQHYTLEPARLSGGAEERHQRGPRNDAPTYPVTQPGGQQSQPAYGYPQHKAGDGFREPRN